jgi:hypothetical protein
VSADVAVWVYDDKDSSLILTLKDSTGAAIDLTGATSITLQIQKMGATGAAGSVSGSIYGTATNGQARFLAIAQDSDIADPGPNRMDRYRARMRWLRSGNNAPDYSWSRGEVTFGIRRFPA